METRKTVIDLTGIVDKMENKNTTSLKFKHDLIDFFQNIEGSKEFICTEVGISLGYSTSILAQLFKTVYALEYDGNNVEHAKKFNEKHSNIIYRTIDVYREDWGISDHIDVSFIDCVHDYIHVKQDIVNSLKKGKKELYLVFDDYGLIPEVKRAVDDFIGSTDCTVTFIGHPTGTLVATDRVTKASEGIILKVNL